MKKKINKLCLSFLHRVANKVFLQSRKAKLQQKKTISGLRLQDDSTTNNENVILDLIETFYKNLYTSEGSFSDEECDLFIRNLEIPTPTDEDRDNLEGPLTYDECGKALETFQNDKAPEKTVLQSNFINISLVY